MYGDSDISELGFELQIPTQEQRDNEKVNCRAVIVRSSKFGDGAFAARDIKQGECIEWGIVRRLPPGFDGNAAEYVFTWSDDRTVWAITSGTAAFLNTAAHGKANTKMIRFFNEDRFEIYAVSDIADGEELTHTYKSLRWRTCFKPLAENLGVTTESTTKILNGVCKHTNGTSGHDATKKEQNGVVHC